MARVPSTTLTRTRVLSVVRGIFTTALTAVLAAGLGCQKPASRAETLAAVPVEIIEVIPASLEETTALSGVLAAIRGVDVVSEVAGRIETIHRDVGQTVREGDPLATLDTQVMRETLNQAEAALLAAGARHAMAKEDLSRDSTLFSHGDIAQAALDAGTMAYTAALADLKAARAARELAARSLSEADIRAPFAGVVARRHCDLGSYVAPGMPVFRVVALDSLRLVVNVSQRHVGRLSVDGSVTMTTDALGDRQFVGRIRSISPEADSMTRTFPVEVLFANPPGRPLRSGLVVRATLMLGALDERIAVPREAVIRRTGGHFVFVVADSVATQRIVTLGPLIGDQYVVEEGLESGEQLVVAGVQNLHDGAPVSIEAHGTVQKGEEESP
ncbi:efflux RND transporter periplasmic adaptor subunit [Candidatus Fermentibacteria bacterium]|nr:efflux RND transporter periplasmic adaptor subunit [Candidatus Fermentibacteria bacterium]